MAVRTNRLFGFVPSLVPVLFV